MGHVQTPHGIKQAPQKSGLHFGLPTPPHLGPPRTLPQLSSQHLPLPKSYYIFIHLLAHDLSSPLGFKFLKGKNFVSLTTVAAEHQKHPGIVGIQ